jgi:hypothetical protein
MWMKLREYLDKGNWRGCFLTNRGDADVIFEMREYRLDWAQKELKEALEDWDQDQPAMRPSVEPGSEGLLGYAVLLEGLD